jgi:hypothetical protein
MTTPQLLFADNVNSVTLASPITSIATTLSVVAGGGSLFPVANPSTNQAFIFTLVKNGNPNIFEVCLCTSRSGDTFNTITRNYEGTQGAQNWNAGDYVNLYPTASGLNSMLQPVTAQAEQYNYALDTGSANTYQVTLSPASGLLFNGQRFRFIAAHTNTGASTFNGNALVLPNGNALPANAIIAGGYYEAVYYNGSYQLFGGQNYNNVALTGVSTAPTASYGTNTTQIASTAFVQASTTTGTTSAGRWVKYPNGVIDQWGETPPSGNLATVTFPLVFPNLCESITVSQVGAQSTFYVSQPSSSNTQFTIEIGASGTQFCWRASGH